MTDLATQQHLSEEETILTASEAQAYTRTSHSTLRKLANAGAVPFIQMTDKPRSHKRYRLADLRRFLESKTISKS